MIINVLRPSRDFFGISFDRITGPPDNAILSA